MSDLKVISKKTTENFAIDDGVSVNVTNWSSGEGVDILVQGDGRVTLLHGSLTWDEIELLKLALERADHA